MEMEAAVMSFLALFIGVFAFQSLLTSLGTGILARIAGLFGFQTSHNLALFLCSVIIVLVILIISNYSCLVDSVRIDVKSEDVVAIWLLASFFAIFALLSLYAPGGILMRISGMYGVWTRPCAPFSWVAVIVAALVTITKGGDKCLLSLLGSTYAENH